MSVRKGTYILIVTLDEDRNITVGAKGPHYFSKGQYCYVGSAMAGLDQRLKRHLAHEKKLKWHIDYLTTVCSRSEAWESYPDFIPECELGRIVETCGGIPEMDGFGCSDCDCRTHLFKVDSDTISRVLASTGLERHPRGYIQTSRPTISILNKLASQTISYCFRAVRGRLIWLATKRTANLPLMSLIR